MSEMRSCDFCPDGCCDMDCSYCYGMLARDNPYTFAFNVRTAAILCRAFDLGHRGATRLWTHDDLDEWSRWKPGCGKAAP